MRRFFDVVVCAVGLVVAAPLLAAVAVMIVLDDGRPVLFSQIRVGRHGVPFRIYKFRTMRFAGSIAGITVAGDPRVTLSGRFLRATKLDELPQLWNVIRGDMSIIGPRPELPAFVDRFPAQYEALLTVRPGLVDPATIAFAGEADILARYADPQEAYLTRILPEKLALSRTYLMKRTLRRDLRLIVDAFKLGGKAIFR